MVVYLTGRLISPNGVLSDGGVSITGVELQNSAINAVARVNSLPDMAKLNEEDDDDDDDEEGDDDVGGESGAKKGKKSKGKKGKKEKGKKGKEGKEKKSKGKKEKGDANSIEWISLVSLF